MTAFAVGAVAFANVTARAPAEACTDADVCRGVLQVDSGGVIPIYRTLPLRRNDIVRRAAIVVHGNRRDADRYFDRLVAAAQAEDRLKDTILLAPQYQTRKDDPAKSEHYWSSSGWKIGDKSKDGGRISSFAVMDQLLALICPTSDKLFPSLQQVVISGHSAGGQFVNRYAAGGRGCPDGAVEVRYLVMNPSSYLYPDGRRREGIDGQFAAPDSSCSDYDEYKYGLRDLNAYMKKVGAERIRANLFSRQTYYLAGAEDTRIGSSLDTSCRGILQGPNRLARHVNYRQYAKLFDGWTRSVFVIVPGIGHSGGKMLMSEEARRVTFR